MSLPGVATLCFHGIVDKRQPGPFRELHVTPETLASVCRVAADTCSPISLNDLRAARDGRRTLPPRPVLFTFDDGYVSVLERALPVLERFGIPAAVFACSGPIRYGRHFWFDALARRSGEEAVAQARSLSYEQWAGLVATLDQTVDPRETHRPLNVSELRQLAGSPLIEIAAHTVWHPVLSHAPVEEQRREISGSRAMLAEMIGTPVRAFAYPFGEPQQDFTNTAVAAVGDAGFDLAYSTVQTLGQPSADPLALPRFVMLDSVGGAELAHRLSHSWLPSQAEAAGAPSVCLQAVQSQPQG
jgi:peptidoglycan/xylan/chitin deacetylase (PgdA/CDA1 family)